MSEERTKQLTIYSNEQTVTVPFTEGEKIGAILERGNIRAQNSSARILMDGDQATLDSLVASVDTEILLLGAWTNGDKKKV